MRSLSIFNLLGVAALALLCVVQWRSSSRDGRNLQALEQKCLDQTARLEKQGEQLAGANADLEELRNRLVDSQAALADTRRQLDTATSARDHLEAERRQMQTALSQWAGAVATRDQALQNASRDIQRLTLARNQAVLKFNELVARYNALVRQINQAATQPAAAPGTQPARSQMAPGR